MSDKNYVGMFNCPLCNEPIGLILNKRLSKTLPRNCIIGPELCDNCKKNLTEKGTIILYEAEQTGNKKEPYKLLGRFVEVNIDPFLDGNNDEFLQKERIAFCDSEMINHIISLRDKKNEQN